MSWQGERVDSIDLNALLVTRGLKVDGRVYRERDRGVCDGHRGALGHRRPLRGRSRSRYRGYVPIQQAAALDRLTRDGTLSLRDACRLLLRRRAIIHIDPADDIEPER